MRRFPRKHVLSVVSLLGTVLGMVLLMARPVYAAPKITESDSPIYDRRSSRTLENVSASALKVATEPAGPRDIVVLAIQGGAYVDIRLFGRSGAIEPRALGSVLADIAHDAGLDAAQITYSADEYPAARAFMADAHFGARSASQNIAAGRLVAGLRRAGYEPHAIWILPGHVRRAEMTLPHDKNYFDISGAPADLTMTGTATLSSSDLLAVVFFVAFVPLVGAGGIIAAIVVGRRESIPRERRRALYPKLAQWPTFGAMALHLPFTLFYLRSPGPRLIADLWSGSPTASGFFVPFLALGPVCLIVLLPIAAHVERTLFGPAEANPDAPKVPEMSPGEKHLRRQMLMASLLPLPAIYLPLVLFGDRLLGKSAGAMALPIGLISTFALSQLIAAPFRRRLKAFEIAPTEDPELTDEAMALAQKAGVAVKSVRIDESRAGQTAANASVLPSGAITITRRAMNVLTAPQRAFLLAHEMAHLKNRDALRRLVLLVPVLPLMMLPLLILRSGGSVARLPEPWQTLTLFAPFLALPLMFIVMPWLNRRREFDADVFALKLTGDLPAAESALTAIARNSPLPHVHEIDTIAATHPSLPKRLARLRRAAEAAGIRPER